MFRAHRELSIHAGDVDFHGLSVELRHLGMLVSWQWLLAMNVALQLSDFFRQFCALLVAVALLGALLADPGPPEANATARTFQIS